MREIRRKGEKEKYEKGQTLFFMVFMKMLMYCTVMKRLKRRVRY